MIIYRNIKITEIDLLESLWYMNKDYHTNISPYFKINYSHLSFDGRFNNLDHNEDYIVTIAEHDNNPIGYIITILNDGIGEHLSLHVNELYRGRGIGKELLTIHKDWLDSKHCKDISIKVSYENISTIEFYKSQGFMPDILEMKLQKNS